MARHQVLAIVTRRSINTTKGRRGTKKGSTILILLSSAKPLTKWWRKLQTISFTTTSNTIILQWTKNKMSRTFKCHRESCNYLCLCSNFKSRNSLGIGESALPFWMTSTICGACHLVEIIVQWIPVAIQNVLTYLQLVISNCKSTKFSPRLMAQLLLTLNHNSRLQVQMSSDYLPKTNSSWIRSTCSTYLPRTPFLWAFHKAPYSITSSSKLIMPLSNKFLNRS